MMKSFSRPEASTNTSIPQSSAPSGVGRIITQEPKGTPVPSSNGDTPAAEEKKEKTSPFKLHSIATLESLFAIVAQVRQRELAELASSRHEVVRSMTDCYPALIKLLEEGYKAFMAEPTTVIGSTSEGKVYPFPEGVLSPLDVQIAFERKGYSIQVLDTDQQAEPTLIGLKECVSKLVKFCLSL